MKPETPPSDDEESDELPPQCQGLRGATPAHDLGTQSLRREFSYMPVLVPAEIECPCPCPCCVKGHYWGGPERSRNSQEGTTSCLSTRPPVILQRPLWLPLTGGQKVILHLEATSEGTSLKKNAVAHPTNAMLFFRNTINTHKL